MTIGKRIKHKRKAKGLSQHELASMLGVSRSLIGQIETDKSNPSLENLAQMIRILDTSYVYMIDGNEVVSGSFGRVSEENAAYQSHLHAGPVVSEPPPPIDPQDNRALRQHIFYQADIIEHIKSENKALRDGMAALAELLAHYQQKNAPAPPAAD